MATLASGRVLVLGLLALAAAAPAARAQSQPGFQVEASLDHTGSSSMHSVIADGTDGGFQLSQREAVRYSVGASRLARLAPRASLRFGVSLANKGFTERFTSNARTSERHVDLIYLGAPLALGYNLVNSRRGLVPFAEAGVVPELLLRRDESEFQYDFRDVGVSYLLNLGVKYNFANGRALLLAPEARIAAREYSRDTPGGLEYRPTTVGLKLGVQF